MERFVKNETPQLWEPGVANVDALVSACHLPVIALDLDCNVSLWNPAAEHLFGWGTADIIGRRPLWVPEDQLDEHKTLCDRVLEGEVVVGAQISRKRKDGSILDIRVSIGPLRDEADRVRGMVGIVEPPGAADAAPESRFRSQRMETLGTLAAGVAHDFNNILQSISGNGEFAKESVAPGSSTGKQIEQILSAAQRGKELVSQILAFSRDTEVGRTPIDLHSVLCDALGLLRAILPSTIEIEERVDSIRMPVMGNVGQIHQVLLNIGGNAIHAMKRSGGVLTVSLEKVFVDGNLAIGLGVKHRGCYAKLSIQDTGHGMDVPLLERIYEPFFTTKAGDEGTGLGLSIVRDIIVAHEGAMHVRSEPGVGTTFDLYFPQTSGVASGSGDSSHNDCAGTERILFVDDEEAIAEMGKLMLEKQGYSVFATSDSQEALRVFRSQPDHFDAVVTDHTMPRLTGLALARELKLLRPNIPIILVSGFSPQCAEETEENCDIDAVVSKPFDSSEIARVMREALDRTSTPRL